MTESELEAYAEGGNFRVSITEGVATVRVWRRPDVSREVGASYAREMVVVYGRLALEPWPLVRGVVMDLRDATTTWGPVTKAAIGEMFAAIEAVQRRNAVVTANDPIQVSLAAAVLRDHAPRFGRAFASISAARRWVTMLRQAPGVGA